MVSSLTLIFSLKSLSGPLARTSLFNKEIYPSIKFKGIIIAQELLFFTMIFIMQQPFLLFSFKPFSQLIVRGMLNLFLSYKKPIFGVFWLLMARSHSCIVLASCPWGVIGSNQSRPSKFCLYEKTWRCHHQGCWALKIDLSKDWCDLDSLSDLSQ